MGLMEKGGLGFDWWDLLHDDSGCDCRDSGYVLVKQGRGGRRETETEVEEKQNGATSPSALPPLEQKSTKTGVR